jgi:hypothetical protein
MGIPTQEDTRFPPWFCPEDTSHVQKPLFCDSRTAPSTSHALLVTHGLPPPCYVEMSRGLAPEEVTLIQPEVNVPVF